MSTDVHAAGQQTPLRRTALHALHVALGAKLVPFAGYEMPLQYPPGIKSEHLHTRGQAGLFDVSHMGQISIEGPPAALEALVTGDIGNLTVGHQRYTLLTNAGGGIIDDLMVARLPTSLHVVVNAANKDAVAAHISDGIGATCTARLVNERALLALQGPAAVTVLAALEPALSSLPFMALHECALAGHPCLVSRSGYTGEDGFEISLGAESAEALARLLLADKRVKAIGLGARDSLRLEAGLCLSGSDIGADTTPIEAGLGWTVAKKYRDANAQPAAFPGAATILAQLKDGAPRRRVGLRPSGRIPLRAGTIVHSADGHEAGTITSGSFGPSVNHPVAMAYLNRDVAGTDAALSVTIRERRHAVEIVSLPFLPHRYFRG